MNVTVEMTPESEANFHIELVWNEIDKASDRVYRRIAQKQNVPGFRPGHAPRSMLERIVGRDAIYEEAIDALVEDAVRAKAREEDLTLLSTPHAHVHTINYGSDHEVTVTVPVLGKGELADYHDIHVTLEPVVVTEEDIDTVINRARDSMAVWVPVDRPAAMGDRVTVDMVLTIGEKEISNLKEHDFDLVDDRTGLFTGMDQEIAGMTEGDTKEFTTTLPEDYPKTELAGQPAQYHVTLNKVAIKELPAVDDEFAKEAGKFDSVEAMRAGVRDDLTRSRQQTAERNGRDQLTDALIERLVLNVPGVLVDAEAQDMLQELGNLLGSENVDLNRYLQMMGTNQEDYLKQMRPEAERRIKQRRALELVAEREGITVAPRELQSLLDSFATSSGRGRTRVDQLKSTQRIVLERSLLRDKAQAWLTEHLIEASDATDGEGALVAATDTADEVQEQQPDKATDKPAPASTVAEAKLPVSQQD